MNNLANLERLIAELADRDALLATRMQMEVEQIKVRVAELVSLIDDAQSGYIGGTREDSEWNARRDEAMKEPDNG